MPGGGAKDENRAREEEREKKTDMPNERKPSVYTSKIIKTSERSETTSFNCHFGFRNVSLGTNHWF